MRVYLVNDTASWHAGSQAVMAVLRNRLIAHGHEICFETPRPESPNHEWITASDAIVVNGEGTLQEENKGWYDGRARKTMQGLALAKQLGKKAYLLNAVWFRMAPGWGPLLRSLDDLTVREVCSQDEMFRVQGVRPRLYLDLSYAHRVTETDPASDLQNQLVVGSFYRRYMAQGDVFDHTHPIFSGLPRLHLGGVAEQQHEPYAPRPEIPDWATLVQRLRGAALYVTGQQHGVYLACRARVPFAVFRTHNHKTKGIFKTAGLDIPIASTRAELEANMDWAMQNEDRFRELFDWMETQPQWPGID